MGVVPCRVTARKDEHLLLYTTRVYVQQILLKMIMKKDIEIRYDYRN